MTIIVIVQAHPLPFNNPYETIKYIIPIMTIPIPNIIGTMPRAAISAASVEPPSDDTVDNKPPKAIKPNPPIKSAIPPMMVSMAMIVTPIGLFVFEFKLISKVN